jgi:Tfp pilus assembly protein PilV
MNKKPRQAGFTLVEAIVTALVLAVGVMGLMGAFALSGALSQTAREWTVASTAARGKIEEIRGASYTSVLATYNNQSFQVAGLTPARGDEDGVVGRVTVTVPTPPNDASRLLEVVVEIHWDGSVPDRLLVYRTNLAQRAGF